MEIKMKKQLVKIEMIVEINRGIESETIAQKVKWLKLDLKNEMDYSDEIKIKKIKSKFIKEK